MGKLGLLPVAYIGQEDGWQDYLYGSGLYFVAGQTRMVELALARKLLKHVDLFAEGEAKGAEKQETAKLTQQAKQARQDEEAQLDELFDVFGNLDRMDKASLQKFIKDNFNQDVDGRLSETKVREHAKMLIDQFGLPS